MKGTPDDLLRRLLEADSEQDVILALRRSEVWDDDAAWRFYGDTERNWGSAGNQQRTPEAALVEKIINAVDACLMLKCLLAGIDPAGPLAPRTLREAVARFFEEIPPTAIQDYHGVLSEWPEGLIKKWERTISLAATGSRTDPCISIFDAGEGQAPEDLPSTILSLTEGTGAKHKVRFVQGKWNMGGTGALRFAGERGLQLVVSKRHPELARREGKSQAWGFTVVRRDYPDSSRSVSALRYLAPVGGDEKPGRGEVLSIESKELCIAPIGQAPNARSVEWGTLVKLYEYSTRYRTHMFRRSGLLERLGVLLPGVALPIRLHECRDYKGNAGSFETTLTGVIARLGKSSNLEDGFPTGGTIGIEGESIPFTIYALKAGSEETYRGRDGVIFAVNGQAHDVLSDRFFRRAGMGLIKNSLLVVADCTEISDLVFERLFMNSRDRLADSKLAQEVQNELADQLRRHDGLRALRERRRFEDAAAKVAAGKPLEDVLGNIIQKSPSLTSMFLPGNRLSNPFKRIDAPIGGPFSGRSHPTFFKFKDMEYGHMLKRDCHLGQRLRIAFDTDAENGYFSRRANRGRCVVRSDGGAVIGSTSTNLHNGFAHLNIALPSGVAAGDRLSLTIEVSDPTLVEPFVNRADVRVLKEQPSRPGGKKTTRNEREETDPEGHMGKAPEGLALPVFTRVYEPDWARHAMDKSSAVRAEEIGETEGGTKVFEFFVNMDHQYLLAELKAAHEPTELLRARFELGLVLVGMAVLNSVVGPHAEAAKELWGEMDPEDAIAACTDASAPMLLPMLGSLGGLSESDLTDDEDDD